MRNAKSCFVEVYRVIYPSMGLETPYTSKEQDLILNYYLHSTSSYCVHVFLLVYSFSPHLFVYLMLI